MYVYVYVYVAMCVCEAMYVCVWVCVCEWVCACMRSCMRECVRACARECVRLCVCVWQTAVYVSLMGLVQVRLQVPTPSPWDMVQPHLQGTSPPQVDLPALTLSTRLVPRHSSASLGWRDHLVAAEDFSLLFCVCMHACVHVHFCM